MATPKQKAFASAIDAGKPDRQDRSPHAMRFRNYSIDEIQSMPLEQLEKRLLDCRNTIAVMDFGIVIFCAWLVCRLLP